MTEGGRYRKVYVRLWRHVGFRALAREEQLLALYLLTSPATNRIGIYYLSLASAAEDLGMVPDTLPERLANVCRTLAWEFDPVAQVVFVPSWWKWNAPSNHNVLRGSLTDVAEVPSCALVDKFKQHLDFLHPKYHETVRDSFRQRFGNHSVNVSGTTAKGTPNTGSGTGTGSGSGSLKSSPLRGRRKGSPLRGRQVRRKDGRDENPDDNVGVITKLAHTVMDDFGDSHQDLGELVKSACAREKVNYNGQTVRKAIESAQVQRQRARKDAAAS